MVFRLKRVHHLTLNVSDPNTSRRFYEGVLGLEVDQDFPPEPGHPGKLRVRLADGTRIVLVPPLPGTPEGDRFDERRVGLDHISVGMAASELEPLVAALRAAGIATEGIKRDKLGPGVVCFRDPDNIAWECFEDDG